MLPSRVIVLVPAAILALAGTPSSAQAPAQSSPIVKQTFEQGEEGWTSMGPNASVAVTKNAAETHEGKPALRFRYAVAKSEVNAAICPIMGQDLSAAKSVRMWVKASHATTLGLVLQESGGGRFLYPFTVPKEKWSQVEAAPGDFMLMDGQDDPKDANGKLDMDKVEAFALADVAQMLIQMGDEAAKLMGIETGQRSVYLSELAVTRDVLPPAQELSGNVMLIDTFARPLPSWVGVGGVKLSVVADKALKGRALQADYHVGPGALAGLLRFVPKGKLAEAKYVTFEAAATKPTRLVVQVEETGTGAKYRTMVELKGNSQPETISLKFADFTPTEDSKVTTGSPNMAKINQFILADPTGLFGGADQDITLWIGKVRATVSPEK